MINVRDYGAYGDNLTIDTAAIQAAAEASRLGDLTHVDIKGISAIQPLGGSYMGSSNPLFFPTGRYLLDKAINLHGYQVVLGEDAILIQQNPTEDIFTFSGCYRNIVSGLQFMGGRRHLNFTNNNVDMTRLIVSNSVFQGWADYAICAEAPSGDMHMSANLALNLCVFDGPKFLRTRCDSTTLNSCRHQFRGAVTSGMCSIENLYQGGVLHLNDFTGTPVPAEGIVPYWVNNYGSTIADGCRFGGEGGGIPIVYHNGGPNLINPWMGSAIVLANSQVSCGRNLWPESALVTLNGIPQLISITNCRGVVSSTIPTIKAAPGYDVTAAVNTIVAGAKTSLSMYGIRLTPNQFYAPAAIPTALTQFIK